MIKQTTDTLTLKEFNKSMKILAKNKIPFKDACAWAALRMGTTVTYKKK